ncbi:MAG: response regulator [Acidobacteria bacterium]|nr:response regulator [Acidobacteriota bacterium]
MEEDKPLILIIDDEESMRDSCSLILAREKLATLTADNGALGIRTAQESKPDLCLIDLKIPGLSGFEVLDQIKAIDPHIICIVITGYATVESAVEAMRRGAYDFLPKPFTPEELRIIIRRGLERRRLFLEAESLRREKKLMEENFITLVSHQLRSPLVAIAQYFEVILGGIVKDENTKAEMLSKAKNRVEGLLDLINDWLDIARMNAGQIIDNLKPFSITSLLQQQMEFYTPSAEEKGIHLTLDPPEGSDRVRGDSESLEQVFSNLISNAIKYNVKGGSIRLHSRGEETWIAVTVSDTGMGIPEEHLPYLFDQFYRVKRSESEKQKGSGLGLSIALKIVEAHKGRIEVSSTPGKGSTFTVYLPKAVG